MNYFLKYRFAIWVIILLSVIFLSSIGTIVFFKLTANKEKSFKDPENNRHIQIAKFFRNELKLSSDQEKSFKEFRRVFFKNSRIIFDSLEKKRLVMIEELGKSNPDTSLLFKISNDIGKLHADLKRETVKNLMNLRSICTPEQIQKLNTINKELIGPEGPMFRKKKHIIKKDFNKTPN